jgi:hypothetical protein
LKPEKGITLPNFLIAETEIIKTVGALREKKNEFKRI